MAKATKKSSPAQQAAAKKAAATNTETKKDVNPVVDAFQNSMINNQKTGLDANRQVDLLTGIKAYFHDDKDAAAHTGLAQEKIDIINGVAAIGFATVFVHECLTAETPFAITLRKTQLEALKQIAPEIGFQFNDHLLPAPNEAGEVQVSSAAIEVSEETKKKHAEEEAAKVKKPTVDPTKVTNETEERDALIAILGDNKIARPVDRIMKAVNFKKAVMQIAASKLEEDAKIKELDSIKAMSTADTFREIANLIGPASFSVSGISNFIFNQTSMYKDPIIAFCLLRKASVDKKSGSPMFDDATIADIAKVLVYWHAETRIAEHKKTIKDTEKRINKRTAELEKAKTAEADIEKANSDDKNVIAKAEENITYLTSITEIANHPSGDFVDKFIEIFNNKEDELYIHSHLVTSHICSCYMPEVRFSKNNMTIESEEVNKDIVLKNVQQYCGMIINHFRGDGAALVGYSEGNILPIKEETEEEESKN